MYDFLRGRVVKKLPTAVVLDVAGVGWLLETSLRTSGVLIPGKDALVLVHFRQTEDSTRLFGFSAEDERDLFRRLLRTSGVGPAHALNLCSAFAPEQVWRALADGDEKRLSSPKGIGAKLAQRLIAELKDEAARRAGPGASSAAGDDSAFSGADDAADALAVLGYADSAARKAVATARKRLGSDAAVDEIVKEALRAAQ